MDGPLNQSVSESRIIETVPITVSGDSNGQAIEVLEYGPDRIRMKAEAENSSMLQILGLYPGAAYVLDINGTSDEVIPGKNGSLRLDIPGSKAPSNITIIKK